MNIRILALTFLLSLTQAEKNAPTHTLTQVTDPLSFEVLNRLEKRLQSLHKKVKDSVVAIKIVNQNNDEWALGSATIVSPDGLILSCYHVVEDLENPPTPTTPLSFFPKPASKEPIVLSAKVILSDGSEWKAELLGVNRNLDVGFLKIISPPEHLTYTPIAKSPTLNELDWVVSYGHAEGYSHTRSAPMRLGKILTKDFGTAFIQTDCPIVVGDSGGPLFNLEGEIIGVNSFIGNDINHNKHSSVQHFEPFITDMVAGKRIGKLDANLLVDTPVIGIKYERSREGVRITKVVPDSPASKAKLRTGDIITHVDGKYLYKPNYIIKFISARPVGSQVKLSFLREGEKRTTTLTTKRKALVYYDR